jgi:hypothetical protein
MGEITIVEGMVSIEQMKAQVQGIQELMKGVMVEDQHWGKVPGCGDKPTLLKAGAEKLSLAFNLDLQTETEVVDMGNMHREYRCTTTVYSKASGDRLGNGAGCATTLESKWRYRSENTGAMVPAEYWDSRDSELLGGSQFSTRKVEGKWFIFHKVDHDNPADYYNTCLKMAEKRSKVCAVLNVTAASDIFTQDIEEMGAVLGTDKATTTTKTKAKPPVKKTQSKKASKGAVEEHFISVKDVSIQEGTSKKSGKPYTKYTIESTEGSTYSTFSDTWGNEAMEIVGTDVQVRILFELGQYGNTITEFDITGDVPTDENLETTADVEAKGH